MSSGTSAQLRALLAELGAGLSAGELAHIAQELRTLGQRWPQENAAGMDKLVRHLPKFTDSQQQDIVSAFSPLRSDVCQRMATAAKALNAWLQDGDKASVQRLVDIMCSIEDAPQLRCFKHCCESPTEKVRFLWSLASVISAVLDDKGPVGMRARILPRAVELARQLQCSFFELTECGNVLGSWHSGRLERYNAAFSRAGKRAAEQLRPELQNKLLSALRTATMSARPVIQLELRDWPMSGCPLARAFLDFVTMYRRELSDGGHPSLAECPPHSLQPSTLRKLLRRFDIFEVVPSEPVKGRRAGPGIVRVRAGVNPSTLDSGSSKAVGTKPKAAPMAPPTASAPPAASSVTAEQLATTPRLTGTATATTPKSAAAPKLVRRRINWNNADFLRRVVMGGKNSGDTEWMSKWQQFAMQKQLPLDMSNKQSATQHKDALAEFVEENLAVLLKRPWAKSLMFKVEGASDDLPPETEEEPPGASRRTGSAEPLASASGGGGAAMSEKGAPASSVGRGSTKRSAGSKASDVIDSSRDSDSSDERPKPKKRRRDKKAKSMMGYNEYISGMEAMMMNQMMMSSMMGMGLMGMGMMPGMVGMTPGGKAQRKDDKGKKGAIVKADDKTRMTREREKRRNDSMINTDDL
eukprot:TRINITY_DN24347_c0_g1_i1.p1 TRINITY_DN24347_c0_g1~~TRINITY_DN24347_c0_g1_i1.p1  ORF type:complete len:638 (-),score=117.25 TRINITY_DN24347_c0_g1_i1:212-2125(-)